jgi:hypothetical protein
MSDPLAYWRQSFVATQPVQQVIRSTDPTVYDVQFSLNQEWLNEDSGACWKFTGRIGNLARWEQVDNAITDLLNGQLLIGSTGLPPVGANITAGGGISVTNGAGSITISANDQIEDISSSQSLEPNKVYFVESMASVDLTLPVTIAKGATIEILSRGTIFTIKQNAGQRIFFVGQNTTTGVLGSVVSETANECLTVRCVVANTDFIIHPSTGNFGLN